MHVALINIVIFISCNISMSVASEFFYYQRNPVIMNRWKPGQYKGLIVGKSKYNDIVRIMGKPISIGPMVERDESSKDPSLYIQYGNIGEFDGELAFVIGEKSRILFAIINYPSNLSLTSAIAHYGDNYRKRQLAFCPWDEWTSKPYYETPDGNIVRIDYPDLGISISIDEAEKVTHIVYDDADYVLNSIEECQRELSKRKKKQ